MVTGILGLIFGILAAAFLLVGLIPLLGWLNWFTSLPLAVIGLVLSQVSARGKIGSRIGIAGSVFNGAVIAVALFRLFLGGGIF